MQPALKSALRGALDLILPPQALDGGARPMSQGLSGAAWAKIHFLEDPVCDGCGLPFEYSLGPGARCAACMARPRAFARAACLYDEASRDLILKLKHADRPELAGLFAGWLSRAAADLTQDADLIAPVPLHPLRLLKRRYNQAAEIARILARRTGVPYAPALLRRHRATESQGGKSGRGRRINVSGAFEVGGPAGRLAGARVLLIDDVLTTGATAEACAKVLLKAGAAAVDLGVVARVREAANPTI